VPTAKVYAGGFSLGSGVQGDGVLRAVNLGANSYVFTDAPKAAAAPTKKSKTGSSSQ